MDNNFKKVAILLMKGFDGCGVSRFAIEHQKELRKQGHICDVYSFNKKYSRTKAHDDKDVIWYDTVLELPLKEYDYILLNSYPKQIEEVRDQFEYLKQLKVPKIALMHELVRQNVSRIKGVWEWMEMADIVTSFSEEMDFTQDMLAKMPDKKYFSFKMGTSDDELDEMYEKTKNKEKDFRLVYFGRASGMKDPERLYLIKEHDKDIETVEIGIERSIGAVVPFFKNPLSQVMTGFINTREDIKTDEHDKNYVQVYGPANRKVGLDFVGESAYGASFYKTKKINNLGNRMEYTQIEMSCVTLPLFDIEWGKNVVDVETGKTFYEIGDNAIYSDRENIQGTIDEMKYLYENPEEYNRRRENIFKLVKRNFGSKVAVNSFYENVDKLLNS